MRAFLPDRHRVTGEGEGRKKNFVPDSAAVSLT